MTRFLHVWFTATEERLHKTIAAAGADHRDSSVASEFELALRCKYRVCVDNMVSFLDGMWEHGYRVENVQFETAQLAADLRAISADVLAPQANIMAAAADELDRLA